MAKGNDAMKKIICILVFAALCFADSAYNFKLNTFTVTGLSGTTSKTTASFPAGDCEGVDIIIKSAAKDSSVFT